MVRGLFVAGCFWVVLLEQVLALALIASCSVLESPKKSAVGLVQLEKRYWVLGLHLFSRESS